MYQQYIFLSFVVDYICQMAKTGSVILRLFEMDVTIISFPDTVNNYWGLTKPVLIIYVTAYNVRRHFARVIWAGTQKHN